MSLFSCLGLALRVLLLVLRVLPLFQVLLDCIVEEYHCLRKAATSTNSHGCSTPIGDAADSKIKAA